MNVVCQKAVKFAKEICKGGDMHGRKDLSEAFSSGGGMAGRRLTW